MAEAARLISIPEAPAPAGAQAEWFEGAGGARLRAALFPPPGAARGGVVLSPGRTEPIEKYFETVGDLTGRGFAVLAHDWRGQGLSRRLLADPLRGHAAGVDDFLDDYATLLDRFEARLPKPWIMLGHSMGGCLNLLSLVRGEARFAGALLSAPMLAVATGQIPTLIARGLSSLMLRLGHAASYIGAATDPLADHFAAGTLTHDRARYDRYKAQLNACPALALGGPTWGWLQFAFEAQARLAAPGALERVRIPVALVAAGADRLVINAATRAAAARLADARYVEIPGAYHEVLMETDAVRAEVWRAFDALAGQVTSPSA
ncbi:MAG: alpha/beta hydrolase [Caulobacteraceae bacterium]